MIKLAYSTSGLTQLPFLYALDAIAASGYEGVEISFHRDQFNPFSLSLADLDAVKERLSGNGIKPACVATASHFFDPTRPHEPSLLALDQAARQKRVDLIKRGLHVARYLGANLVTFGSGFLRPEHVRAADVDPFEIVADSIRECLREVREGEDMTLLIEPEPGMLIETIDDGLALIDAVASERFALHLDICHAYCSEDDYIAALGRAAPHTRYLHISDARAGWNLKILEYAPDLLFNLGIASALVHFPDDGDFLLVDGDYPLYFCCETPGARRKELIAALLSKAGVGAAWRQIHYPDLYTGSSALDDEIFTYLISVPRLSFEVLERARPIIGFMRGARSPVLVDRMVANTRTGIVHYHEIPGEGTLDLATSFKALNDNGFNGFGAVELYHHVECWQQALDDSFKHLSAIEQEG